MRFRQVVTVLSVALLSAEHVVAEPVSCEDSLISVDAPDDQQRHDICVGARQAIEFLAQCNIPLTRPVTIEVTNDLPENCLGLFHCGEQRIEILPEETALARRHPDSVFKKLSGPEFSQSLLLHELAHAAFDEISCPFTGCPATAEYIAYTMQIMSLAPERRAEIEAEWDFDKKVSFDEISAIMLVFAPRVFIRKSWVHLTQRGDKCAYIGKIMDGQIMFDFERI